MPTSKIKTPTETSPPQEVITNIPLSELHLFPNHPFQVRDDDAIPFARPYSKDPLPEKYHCEAQHDRSITTIGLA